MHTASRLAVLLSVVLLLAVASTAEAGPATFIVTTSDDIAGSTCGDVCSLRQAISAANNAGGPATVMLGSDTYTLAIAGIGDDQNEKGDLDPDGDITIQGVSEAGTIIDANHIDTAIHAQDGSLTLKDLTVRNGGNDDTNAGNIFSRATLSLERVTVLDGTAGAPGGTGGIVAFAPTTLTHTSVVGNHADNDGIAGGVFAEAALTMDSSLLEDNHAVGGSAGGLLAASGVSAIHTTITNNELEGAQGGAGGAYLTGLLAESSFEDVWITDNAGSNGDTVGGLWNVGHLTAANVRVTGNNGMNGGPGGIRNEGTINATDLVVDSNESDTGPGGIFSTTHVLTIDRGQITRNTTHGAPVSAGGLAAANRAQVTLTNVTVANNIAETSGTGGIWVGEGSNPPILTLINSTIADNAGFGLRAEVPVNARNTIFANNDTNCSGVKPTYTGVNLDSGTTCQMEAPDLPGTAPQLGPLQDNGGIIETLALNSNSPAIDAIPTDECLLTEWDARNFVRPALTTCDIGAYETESQARQLWGDQDCSRVITVLDALVRLKKAVGLNVTLPDGCPIDGAFSAYKSFSWNNLDCSATSEVADVLPILAHIAGTGMQPFPQCAPIGTEVSPIVQGK